MPRTLFVDRSRNGKTGPIPVTTTERSTCWSGCPLFDAGCYASAPGPLALIWRNLSEGRERDGRGNRILALSWDEMCGKVASLPDGTLWRHNQAGDLPGQGPDIDAAKLGQLVAANKNKRGFTYSHKPIGHAGNAAAIAAANAAGFTINLSGNNVAHADTLADAGIGPVVTVLPQEYERRSKGKEFTETLQEYRDRTAHLPRQTPAGRKVVVCPATTHDDVSCATCGLCALRDREFVIGFPAHGAQKRAADAIAHAA